VGRCAIPALGARWGGLRCDVHIPGLGGSGRRLPLRTAIPPGSPSVLARMWHDRFSSRSNENASATCGHTARDLGGSSAGVRRCAPRYGAVVAQSDTQ
jgi:hypothetical protein